MTPNYGLSPTACHVTALAGQGSRRSGRGLAVRWAKRECEQYLDQVMP